MQKRFSVSVRSILKIVGLSSSSYYYRKRSGSKGAKPTTETFHKTKGFVSENDVITSIKYILSHEFIDCGYHVMTEYLKREGYKINHKKVYRIIKNAGLMKASSRIARGKVQENLFSSEELKHLGH